MPALTGRLPTKFRQAYKAWEAGPGQKYVKHTPGRTNYLQPRSYRGGPNGKPTIPEDLPFPSNPSFRSQPVLSEELKEEVWQAVTKRKRSIRQTSVDYSIDIRRVGAVVRLKEIEKQWLAEGKQLAVPYSQAVMEMLQQTPLTRPITRHESINDLNVHPATMRQVFWPVAESQHFTRVEAGDSFDKGLLPAEARIPHPQLYAIAKGVADGKLKGLVSDEEWEKIHEADAKAQARRLEKVKAQEARTITVQSPRWAFKFEDVVVDNKSTGKFAKGVGARYGMPHEDRKRGQVKIPTSVVG